MVIVNRAVSEKEGVVVYIGHDCEKSYTPVFFASFEDVKKVVDQITFKNFYRPEII